MGKQGIAKRSEYFERFFCSFYSKNLHEKQKILTYK